MTGPRKASYASFQTTLTTPGQTTFGGGTEGLEPPYRLPRCSGCCSGCEWSLFGQDLFLRSYYWMALIGFSIGCQLAINFSPSIVSAAAVEDAKCIETNHGYARVSFEGVWGGL